MKAPLCLYVEKGGKITLTIEGPIRLFVDPRSVRRMMKRRYSADEETSDGAFDTLKKGILSLTDMAKNPLIKKALEKYVPYGNVAIKAAAALNMGIRTGQKILAKYPKATAIVQNLLVQGPKGKEARKLVQGIKIAAMKGDPTAILQMKTIKKIGKTLDNMSKLAGV